MRTSLHQRSTLPSSHQEALKGFVEVFKKRKIRRKTNKTEVKVYESKTKSPNAIPSICRVQMIFAASYGVCTAAGVLEAKAFKSVSVLVPDSFLQYMDRFKEKEKE